MNKRENWPQKMHDYCKAVGKNKFAWGTFDCFLFCAGTVQAMTGEDFAAEFRGKYNEAGSAYSTLIESAGGGIEPLMQKLAGQFGWTETDVLHAQRGDVVLLAPECCNTDERFDGALGMCVGPLSLFVSEKGLRAISTIPAPGSRTVIKAWRIPTKRD